MALLTPEMGGSYWGLMSIELVQPLAPDLEWRRLVRGDLPAARVEHCLCMVP